MPAHIVRLEIENPVLARLITEQLATQKNINIDTDAAPAPAPDCIITQSPKDLSSLTKPVYLNISSKGAIRLGEILDSLGYLLSGREDHIEEDNQHIDLGIFILHPSENLLVHKNSNDKIPLTDKERMLLRYLVKSGLEGMPRTDLLKSVWGYAEETETHTLETHIYRLRQKLENYGAENFIKVQDGRYRISKDL
jgi:DNA-binding winged helix-turn-helix (wHTH) protein